MQKYPIGNRSFRAISENAPLLVDKTTGMSGLASVAVDLCLTMSDIERITVN